MALLAQHGTPMKGGAEKGVEEDHEPYNTLHSRRATFEMGDSQQDGASERSAHIADCCAMSTASTNMPDRMAALEKELSAAKAVLHGFTTVGLPSASAAPEPLPAAAMEPEVGRASLQKPERRTGAPVVASNFENSRAALLSEELTYILEFVNTKVLFLTRFRNHTHT